MAHLKPTDISLYLKLGGINTLYDDYVRGFTQLSRAYYCESARACYKSNVVDDFIISWYLPSGSAPGAFSVEFIRMTDDIGTSVAVPRLSAYNDSWLTFLNMPDLLLYFAQNNDVDFTPEQFRLALLEMGFEDRTPTEPPNLKS